MAHNVLTLRDRARKRRTIEITDEATKSLKVLTNAFKPLNQFDIISLLLEISDPNDPKLNAAASRLSQHLRQQEEEKRKVRERFNNLSPEEMERALRLLDAQQGGQAQG